MFKVFPNKGFQMTFENGWTISVMFGGGSYCENKNDKFWRTGMPITENYESKDAEMAAWDKDGNWWDFGYDTVEGWCDADRVAYFINVIKNQRKIYDKGGAT